MIDIANMLFFMRNGKRAQEGEGGRSVVAVAQGVKFFKQVSKYDNIFAKGAKGALKAFNAISENDKIFNSLSKGMKFASSNVNTLISLSSGLNVLTSKDKQYTFIAESGNLAGMFICERWMKKHLDKIIDKIPINKKWKPIIRGILFVSGSIGGSTLGYKLAKSGADKLKKENAIAQAKLKENRQKLLSDKPKKISYAA